MTDFEPNVIVVGAGLPGLVTTHTRVKAAGGCWSWTRRTATTLQDWLGSAGFDREDEDRWPRCGTA